MPAFLPVLLLKLTDNRDIKSFPGSFSACPVSSLNIYVYANEFFVCACMYVLNCLYADIRIEMYSLGCNLCYKLNAWEILRNI